MPNPTEKQKRLRAPISVEERCLRYALGELLGIPMATWFKELGLPQWMVDDTKQRHGEELRRARNRIVDAAFDVHQKTRLRIEERLLVTCQNAVAVLEAAVEGKPWNGEPVTGQQKSASESALRRLADFGKLHWTPAVDVPVDDTPDELEVMGLSVPVEVLLPDLDEEVDA